MKRDETAEAACFVWLLGIALLVLCVVAFLAFGG